MSPHHAYVVRQNDPTESHRKEYEEGIPHGEVTRYQFGAMGIDDVRELIITAHRRPAMGTTRLLSVVCRDIRSEAQQALLKLLEEPPLSTTLLFVIGTGVQLLPTIQSRVFELPAAPLSMEPLEHEVFTHFLQQSLVDRMAQIELAQKKKDSAWIQSLKQGLLQYLTTKTVHRDRSVQTSYLLVAQYLDSRGAANKYLLEELAMTLPIRTS